MASTQERVCIVTPEFVGPFRNGGVGTAAYWQAVVLARAGHAVSVLYTGPTMAGEADTWTRQFRESLGIDYIDLAGWAEARGLSPVLLPESEPVFTAEQVLSFFRENAFGIIYVQEFLGQGLRVLQANAAGALPHRATTVATLHSPMDWIYEGMAMVPRHEGELHRDFMEKETARLCDVLVAPSAHLAAWVRERWGFSREVRVLPNCFDPAGEADLREPRVFRGFRRLVFFGRLETRKGLHLFLEALAGSEELARLAPELVFLGRPSDVFGRPAREAITEALEGTPYHWEILGEKDAHQAWEWLTAQDDILVLAPSLQDNLPYTLVELFCRRLPFVSTRTGGIPEIVGPANAHLLCEATGPALRAHLEKVLRAGELTIDYRDGYNVATAHRDYLAFHEALAKVSSPARERRDEAVRIHELSTPEALARATADGEDKWLLLVGPGCHLDDGAGEALRAAAEASGLDGAGAYCRLSDPEKEHPPIIAPLGPSAEAGWFAHALSGPFLLVSGKRLRESVPLERLEGASLHEVALACCVCGLRWVVLPETLGEVAASALEADAYDAEDLRLRLCEWLGGTGNAPPAAFPDWLLPFFVARSRPGAARGQGGDGLYRQLAAVDEEDLRDFLFPPAPTPGAPPMAGPGGLNAAFGRARARLEAALEHRAATASGGRLFIYGAGEHSQALAGAVPALLEQAEAFLDRRGERTFLGLPVRLPEEVAPVAGDWIVYSSMAREREMHERLRHLPAEHILLYSGTDSQAAAPAG